jgi:ribonuclease-3
VTVARTASTVGNGGLPDYPAQLITMSEPTPLQQEARRRSLLELQERLGHEFEDLSLLDRALTHASTGNDGMKSYERLEFLGDAFLNFASADWLYRAHAEIEEGALTETRTHIVSRGPLAAVGLRLQLHNHLLSGKGMRETERCSDRILSDLVEAVIGAILIDGGVTAAKAFVRRHVLPKDLVASSGNDTEKDSKTALLHWCQHHKLGQPRYELLATSSASSPGSRMVAARKAAAAPNEPPRRSRPSACWQDSPPHPRANAAEPTVRRRRGSRPRATCSRACGQVDHRRSGGGCSRSPAHCHRVAAVPEVRIVIALRAIMITCRS